jgi:hypothetical protein
MSSSSSAEVKNVGAIPPLSRMSSCHIAWLIKHMNNFTFVLSVCILLSEAGNCDQAILWVNRVTNTARSNQNYMIFPRKGYFAQEHVSEWNNIWECSPENTNYNTGGARGKENHSGTVHLPRRLTEYIYCNRSASGLQKNSLPSRLKHFLVRLPR